jgi:acyl-CoA thioesterase-1
MIRVCLIFLIALLGARGADAAAPRTMLIFGDSLSAAYGIPAATAWPALLAARAKGVEVVNASISGETTAGGRARLAKLLAAQHPSIVLVELGANDGLRGLPLAEIRENLRAIVESIRAAKAKPVLLGIELPVNYGPQYRDGLRAIYRDLATEFNVPLVPFLLEGVAQDDSLLLPDGLHPTTEAQPRVLENVWPVVKPLL